jgi:hypothetical protein
VCFVQYATRVGKTCKQSRRPQRDLACDQALVARNRTGASGKVICTEQVTTDRSYQEFVRRGRALSRCLVARREQRPQNALRSKVVIAIDIISYLPFELSRDRRDHA